MDPGATARHWFGAPRSAAARLLARTNTRLGRNVLANYAGTAVSAAAPLLALPFLVRALGPALWGLVAFSTLLVSTLAVLNSGLAQSMIREFGTRWAAGAEGREASARLLFSYERIYWVAAAVIALAVAPFAPMIVSHWLNVGRIPHATAISTVYCALALFFVQLPSAIYRTLLSALQLQVRLNVVQVGLALSRSAGGVAVALITGSVTAYLLFLVALACCETLALGILAWREMPAPRSRYRWDIAEARATFRFSATMSVIVTLAVATTLIDKYFVSARLPIEQLGVYSIASSLGMGVLQAVYPIFSAALPRLVEIGGDHAARWEANLRLLRIILPMILLGAGLYAVLGRTLLQVWLHDADLARRVAAILDFVLLSSAFNAIYNIGYSNWVSAARTPWIVFVNVTALVIALVATPLAIDAFGLRGAAAALVIINSVGVLATILWLALSRLYLRQAPAA